MRTFKDVAFQCAPGLKDRYVQNIGVVLKLTKNEVLSGNNTAAKNGK